MAHGKIALAPTVDISITGDEARALLDLLEITNRSPTDSLYDLLESLESELPESKGVWRPSEAMNQVMYQEK